MITTGEMLERLFKAENCNRELLDALRNTTVHLIAAHSLLAGGGRKAAASDKIFKMMLDDYEKSFELGRAVIEKATGETP